MAEWGFYGRQSEQGEIRRILTTGRWFFCAVSGRRRIGKTALLQATLKSHAPDNFLYFQIPDADERGVVQVFRDTFEDFHGPNPETLQATAQIKTFADIAELLRQAMRLGWIVVLDEFQYVNRNTLRPFASFLQGVVDELRDTDRGGLFVLGSLHAEMTAILEDKASPLFNRVSHKINLDHWDFQTLLEMFDRHAITDPYHWLFLWSIFEGVPKFYRDVFEQQVLEPAPHYRQATLQSLFFQGSSPLRDEADNWFLHELRGRYDFILKTLATQGPIAHGELQTAYNDDNPNDNNLSQYLNALIEKYRMVERRMPIFATGKSRKARYAIADNFLAAWLAAISRGVRMARFRPTDEAVRRTEQLLTSYEGMAFEKLIRMLIVECSRKAVGDFALSDLVRGYWNKSDGSDIEIDVIAFDEDSRRVRFGSCKRNADRHDTTSLHAFQSHVDRFRAAKEGRKFTCWTVEMAVYAPHFTDNDRRILSQQGLICHDLGDFAGWLHHHRPPMARSDH